VREALRLDEVLVSIAVNPVHLIRVMDLLLEQGKILREKDLRFRWKA